MKEIKAFKLSDGRLIEDKEKAKELQKEIDIKQKLSDLCDKWFVDLEYHEMAEQIYNLRSEFLSALNGNVNIPNI